MLSRKRKAVEADRRQIEEAQESTRRAHESLAATERRGPWVESLVSSLQERREQNGFGEDFQIAMTPRRRIS